MNVHKFESNHITNILIEEYKFREDLNVGPEGLCKYNQEVAALL